MFTNNFKRPNLLQKITRSTLDILRAKSNIFVSKKKKITKFDSCVLTLDSQILGHSINRQNIHSVMVHGVDGHG